MTQTEISPRRWRDQTPGGNEWNARNELTRVTKNSVEQARFSYDPEGRRIEKVAGGLTTTYTYDRGEIVREASGATTLKYLHGPGIDEALAVDDGTALQFFHADSLGSIVKITSAAGAVTFTRQYDAWGNPEIGASQGGFSFTGREWEPESGLYYYRARYYDSRASRFVSEDPIKFGGGLNLYAYVLDNPTNLVDPLGYAGLPTLCVQRVAREVELEWCDKKGRDWKRGKNDPSCRQAHCIANCRISRECAGGSTTAAAWSYVKEFWDEAKERTAQDPSSAGAGYDPDDQRANKKGRMCGTSPYTQRWDCEFLCQGTK